MHLGNAVPQTQAFACGEPPNPAPALGETRPEGEEAGSHLGKHSSPTLLLTALPYKAHN